MSKHPACLQVTGEATYTDDVKLSPDFLHAALVVSSKPYARILSVDPADALKVQPVVPAFPRTESPLHGLCPCLLHR